MAEGVGGKQRSITEEIDELKGKIALLDGDRKAYYESALWTIKKNEEKLSTLRKETKDLRKSYADRLAADDHVINKALGERPIERAVCMKKTGPQAVELLDYKVADTIKKLNALRHTSEVKEKRLAELQVQHEGLVREYSRAEETDMGNSEEAQNLRALENRLDKAELKCKEADHIQQTYQQIKSKLCEEHMQFENVLRDLEEDIRKAKGELNDLRHMNTDAQLSRDVAQKELHKLEEQIYSDRKKREAELQRLRKEAEDRRLHQERIERRIAQRSALVDDSLATGSQSVMGESTNGLNEEQQEKITTYEEAFQKIKDATGVADIKEVVYRFESQGETQQHLEELKANAENQYRRLQEEKQQLELEFEQLKFSGEAKMSSGQRLVEQYELHLKEEQQRCEVNRKQLDKLSKLLITVRTGVEHLNEQLRNVKVADSHAARMQVSPDSDEYSLELLSRSEERLLTILQSLQDTDVQEKLKAMREEEFHSNLESSLPQYNTRVRLPGSQKDAAAFEDDDDSDELEDDVMSRNSLKKQAQQLIDTKTKRKVAKKKKKTK